MSFSFVIWSLRYNDNIILIFVTLEVKCVHFYSNQRHCVLAAHPPAQYSVLNFCQIIAAPFEQM